MEDHVCEWGCHVSIKIPGPNRAHRVSLVALSFGLSLLFPGTGRWLQAQSVADGITSPSFSMSASAEDARPKVGSPVWVDVTIENITDHVISIFISLPPESRYEVDVRDQNMARPGRTRLGKKLSGEPTDGPTELYISSGAYDKLPAGKTIAERLDIAKLYDMKRPGKYTIKLTRFDDQTKAAVTSNSVIVTVVP